MTATTTTTTEEKQVGVAAIQTLCCFRHRHTWSFSSTSVVNLNIGSKYKIQQMILILIIYYIYYIGVFRIYPNRCRQSWKFSAMSQALHEFVRPSSWHGPWWWPVWVDHAESSFTTAASLRRVRHQWTWKQCQKRASPMFKCCENTRVFGNTGADICDLRIERSFLGASTHRLWILTQITQFGYVWPD